MMTTLTATFDGKVLIPAGAVDLPKGTLLRLYVEEAPPQPLAAPVSLAELEACGLWADRTDLGDTALAVRRLRRTASAGTTA